MGDTATAPDPNSLPPLPIDDDGAFAETLIRRPSLMRQLSVGQQIRQQELDEKGPYYHRLLILYKTGEFSDEERQVARGLREMIGLRSKYLFQPMPPTWQPSSIEGKQWHNSSFTLREGVFRLYAPNSNIDLCPVVPATEYFADLEKVTRRGVLLVFVTPTNR
jgi:hypothetical protein